MKRSNHCLQTNSALVSHKDPVSGQISRTLANQMIEMFSGSKEPAYLIFGWPITTGVGVVCLQACDARGSYCQSVGVQESWRAVGAQLERQREYPERIVRSGRVRGREGLSGSLLIRGSD